MFCSVLNCCVEKKSFETASMYLFLNQTEKPFTSKKTEKTDIDFKDCKQLAYATGATA